MVVTRASIICYYDLISPYTYMGFKLFNRFRKQWPNVDVTFRPILLGGVMNEVKNQPLFHFPSKRSHMIADLDRISGVTGIPFNFPQKFPVNTVLPMRVLTALQIHEAADKYEQCIDKLFDEYFIHGRDISQVEVISQALTPLFPSSNGSKIQSYLQRASQDQEIKKVFKQYTDEAIAKGVFGAPTFLVRKAGGEEEMLFFGSDRFEMIAATLGLPYAGLKSASKL